MAEAIRVFNPDRKLQDMHNDINRSFDKLIRDLNIRRNLLLERIEQMREDYRINTDLGNAMKELRMWKDDLKSNLLRSLGEDFDEKLHEFENSKVDTVNLQFVAFRCYSDKIREAIDDIDLFELFPEYVGRENPVLTACYTKGSENGELFNPKGIALDRARAEVYVCDAGNNRIQVLSTVGVYIRQFGGGHLIDPYAICLSQQDELYVTDDATQCVMKFSLTGEFLAQAGSRGTKPEQFDGIRGLCCEAGLVYVCDVNTQIIQIFDSRLKYIKYFGYGELSSPRDITILAGTIYILSEDNCIFCCDLDCTLRKKIELIGQEQLMTSANFFTIDKKGNFLITDQTLGRINIFSPKGVLIHILGAGQLPFLFGIALDKFDWIICVCGSKERFIKF